MVQPRVCKRVMIGGPQVWNWNRNNPQTLPGIGEPHIWNWNRNFPQPLSSIVTEHDTTNEGHVQAITTDSTVKKKTRKRKRSYLKAPKRKAGDYKIKKQRSGDKTEKVHDMHYISRWPKTRYEKAEERMLMILKAQGAVFGTPVSRSTLRSAARPYIGDTGLLDHVLKHMDGKVAPGGADRFRRCHNFQGQMQYWVENADLINIREEAGIKDPFWMPPPGWESGNSLPQDPGYGVELKLLKEELAVLKRDFQQLMSKKQEVAQFNVTPSSSFSNQKLNYDCFPVSSESVEELVAWKDKTVRQLKEISGALSGMQDACTELENWKAKIEKRLKDISSSFSSLQASKQYNTFGPSISDGWEIVFGSTNVVNVQSEELIPWLGSGDLVDMQQGVVLPWEERSDLNKVESETAVQDTRLIPVPGWRHIDSPSRSSPSSSLDYVSPNEVDLLKEEMANMKRTFKELMPKKQEYEEVNVTIDLSVTNGFKMDLDNSVTMLQEMHRGVVNWKAKIERQLAEISSSFK